MRYRVDELAQRTGVSVDTVRYYQTQGLLHRPERDGRVAWYDDSHVQVLERIRDLKARGFTLAMVERALRGELDPGEEALAGELVRPLPDEVDGDDQRFSLAELAARTGVSETVLEALAREGILIPTSDDDRPYTAADARAVTAGMALLEAGVPISELLALAREHDAAMQAVAAQAVDLFARFVRDPIRAEPGDPEEQSARMVAALRTMLPAATELVAHTFRRRLVQAARERLEGGAAAVEDATG